MRDSCANIGWQFMNDLSTIMVGELISFLKKRGQQISVARIPVGQWTEMIGIVCGKGILNNEDAQELNRYLEKVPCALRVQIGKDKKVARTALATAFGISAKLTAEEYWIKHALMAENESVNFDQKKVRRLSLFQDGEGFIDGVFYSLTGKKYILEVKVLRSNTYEVLNGLVQLMDYVMSNSEYAGGVLLGYVPLKVDGKFPPPDTGKFLCALSRAAKRKTFLGKPVEIMLVYHRDAKLFVWSSNDGNEMLQSSEAHECNKREKECPKA